jgi:membrane protein required for colicin V production
MENQLTIVDFGVLGILLVSGLIAAYRGFLKETLTVSAWLLAAVASVFFWPVTKPFARSLVEPKLFADLLALVGVFLMLLIPVSFVSFRLSELVRESRAGPLDRSMGFVFGLARGLLVVGLGYLVFASLAPPKTHPDWVREARLLPIIKGTADVIRSVSGGKAKEAKDTAVVEPEEKPAEEPKPTKIVTKDDVKPADKKPEAELVSDKKEGSGVKSKSYDDGDRRALDQLVRSTAKP